MAANNVFVIQVCECTHSLSLCFKLVIVNHVDVVIWFS